MQSASILQTLYFKMKFLALTIFVFLCLAAFVAAVPADESLPGDLYDQDQYSAQNPQSFFKLKKIKKLLLG
ncbi:uncharacterized protein LOC119607852 [Lucilia sericata]|uniref:uncharacterized protein LOC119607852 n=1 Tax=Lucilia sericata TaxID=13632 RepID=UPI0018A87CA2|nr:uncharacterized protein LOC119607852 [Lucilia sericata]